MDPYAGYMGDLDPDAALALLRQEFNAVLVDIRSQVKVIVAKRGVEDSIAM